MVGSYRYEWMCSKRVDRACDCQCAREGDVEVSRGRSKYVAFRSTIS